jgi:hypothetical protein
LLPIIVVAGNVGKITGKVIDAESKDDLIGVNIIIPALNTGAATDWDGYYFILNIPPGIYEIEASMIGYQAKIKQNVQVFAETEQCNKETALHSLSNSVFCPKDLAVSKSEKQRQR